MKYLILILAFALASQTSIAQRNLTVENCGKKTDYLEIVAYLNNPSNQQKIKELRQWARENDNPIYESMSNKLEYWAKDISRYINKNMDTHFLKVCERVNVKDGKYIIDYLYVTWFQPEWLSLYISDSDLKQYK